MDSASSLAYPGSRPLAGWWRQLQSCAPTGLWVGYLYVHRVEALVEAVEARHLDPLALHLLQALTLSGERSLPEQLHLPPAVVQQLLHGMQTQDLVQRGPAGQWRLSERGQAVARASADLIPSRNRRVFPFVERLSPTGRRAAAPHFVDLAECPAAPWDLDEAHRFDPTLLAECLTQSAEWCERHGFPSGVRRVLTANDNDTNGVWDRVIVDRPQRVAVAVATTAGQQLLAFAAEPEGWKLHVERPIVRLPVAVRDLLVEPTPSSAAWEEAWRLWCRQRNLPRSEAEACRLHFDGLHLDVQAPESFVQRLHAAKSDLTRDDAGLLAGDGYLRALAQLRLRPGA